MGRTRCPLDEEFLNITMIKTPTNWLAFFKYKLVQHFLTTGNGHCLTGFVSLLGDVENGASHVNGQATAVQNGHLPQS